MPIIARAGRARRAAAAVGGFVLALLYIGDVKAVAILTRRRAA